MYDVFNRRNYLWWITISALMPVIETIGSTVFGWSASNINTSMPACFSYAITFPLIYTFTIPLWQSLALRRFAPRLSISYWYGIVLLAFYAYFIAIFILGPTVLARHFIFDPQINPACAIFLNRDALPDILAEVTRGQSLSLMVSYAVIFILLPAIALGVKSDISWRHFFVARLASTCVAVAAPMLTTKLVGAAYPLAQWQSDASWLTFFNIATVRAITGAIEGTVACIVLAALASRRDQRIKKLVPIELLIWLILALQLWICLNVQA